VGCGGRATSFEDARSTNGAFGAAFPNDSSAAIRLFLDGLFELRHAERGRGKGKGEIEEAILIV